MNEEKKKYIPLTPVLFICLLFLIGVILKRGIFYHPSVGNGIYQGFLSLDFYKICQGEWWRLVTFVVYPPGLTTLWSILAIIFSYIIGRNLEDRIGSRLLLYFCMAAIVQIAIAAGFFFLKERVLWLDLSFWGWTLFPILAFLSPGEKVYLLTPFSIRIKLTLIFVTVFLIMRFWLGTFTVRVSLIGQLTSMLLFMLIIRKYRKLPIPIQPTTVS